MGETSLCHQLSQIKSNQVQYLNSLLDPSNLPTSFRLRMAPLRTQESPMSFVDRVSTHGHGRKQAELHCSLQPFQLRRAFMDKETDSCASLELSTHGRTVVSLMHVNVPTTIIGKNRANEFHGRVIVPKTGIRSVIMYGLLSSGLMRLLLMQGCQRPSMTRSSYQ